MLPFSKIFYVTFSACLSLLVLAAFVAAQAMGQSDSNQAGVNKVELTAHKIEFLEMYCFDEVNRQRKENGLEPLVFSGPLLDIARNYSRRMAEEGFFSHTDPQGKTAHDRVNQANLKWNTIGENLLNIKGFINPVPPAVERWMQSAGHRKNILDPEYQYSAVGAWTGPDGMVYFTQIFLGNMPPKQAKKK